jgi:hypothetical protein
MPTAKPRYDPDGSWKVRKYDDASWKALHTRVQKELRPYYPEKNASADPTFGHPAAAWATGLLEAAHTEVSTTLWLGRRLTSAELRAEQADILKTLEKAEQCLSYLSDDLNIMLDVDVLDCRDKIRNLIPSIVATEAIIGKRPRAKKLRDVQRKAAERMAICILRMLNDDGISAAATAHTHLGYVSDAVKILKIIGDALGLRLAEATWKSVIIEAKRVMPVGR